MHTAKEARETPAGAPTNAHGTPRRRGQKGIKNS